MAKAPRITTRIQAKSFVNPEGIVELDLPVEEVVVVVVFCPEVNMATKVVLYVDVALIMVVVVVCVVLVMTIIEVKLTVGE